MKKAYEVVIEKRALKELEKLSKSQRTLLLNWIEKNLKGCNNPRSVAGGKGLDDVKGGWRWRVGVFRILAVIDDDTIFIKIFRIGHRREVYRRLPR